MSYESMARDETCCDFPGHRDANFDTAEGALCAALSNGDVVAFCPEHSQRLRAQGIRLRTVEQARAEYRREKGLVPLVSAEEVQARAEQEFIASLR